LDVEKVKIRKNSIKKNKIKTTGLLILFKSFKNLELFIDKNIIKNIKNVNKIKYKFKKSKLKLRSKIFFIKNIFFWYQIIDNLNTLLKKNKK